MPTGSVRRRRRAGVAIAGPRICLWHMSCHFFYFAVADRVTFMVSLYLLLAKRNRTQEGGLQAYMKEICPRGNNKVIIYFLVS